MGHHIPERYVPTGSWGPGYLVDDSLALDADVWETSGVPRESFISPWAVHSPRIEHLVAWQGRVRTGFVGWTSDVDPEIFVRLDGTGPRDGYTVSPITDVTADGEEFATGRSPVFPRKRRSTWSGR